MPMNLKMPGRRAGRSVSGRSSKTVQTTKSAPVRSLSFMKKNKKIDKRDDDSLEKGFMKGVEDEVRMLTCPPPPVDDVTYRTRDASRTRDTSYNDDATYTTFDDGTHATGVTGADDTVVMKSKFFQGVDRMLGKHEGFQAAPEEVKTEFYESLNQVAAINAQMESKQAEHQLRRLLLDSMCLEAKMDMMMLCAGDIPDDWDERDDEFLDDDDSFRSYDSRSLATDDMTQEHQNALAAVKNVTRKFNFNKKSDKTEQNRKDKRAAKQEKAKQVAEKEAARQAAEKAATKKANAKAKESQLKANQIAIKQTKQRKQAKDAKKKDTKKGSSKSVKSASKSAKSVASSKRSSLKSVREDESMPSEYSDDESYYSYYSDEESSYSGTYDTRFSEYTPVSTIKGSTVRSSTAGGSTTRGSSVRREQSKKSDKKKEAEEPGMITKTVDWIEKMAYNDLVKAYECTPVELQKSAVVDPKAEKQRKKEEEAERKKKKKKKAKKTANADPLLSTLRSNMNNPDPGEGDRYQSVGSEVYDIATLKNSIDAYKSSNFKANKSPEPLATAPRPASNQTRIARPAKQPNKYSLVKRPHTAESVMAASQKSQRQSPYGANLFQPRKQGHQAPPVVAYTPHVPGVPLVRSASMPAVQLAPSVVTASVPMKGGAPEPFIQPTPFGRTPEPIQTGYGRRYAPQEPPPTPTTELSKLREEMPNIPKASKAVQRANKMSGYATPEIEKKSRYDPAIQQEDSMVDRYDVDDIFEGLY